MTTRSIVASRGGEWARVAGLPLAVAAALAITNTGLPQPVTGPLVNALLILIVEWLGVRQALLVGMLTPVGGALRGVLPLPLVVMLPFIAMGNAALSIVYGVLCRRSRVLALAAAAAAKFALLYAATIALTVQPLSLALGGNPQPVLFPAALVEMMRWPQLATALAGGAIAWGVWEAYGRVTARP